MLQAVNFAIIIGKEKRARKLKRFFSIMHNITYPLPSRPDSYRELSGAIGTSPRVKEQENSAIIGEEYKL